MKKASLAVALSLLVALPALAGPRRPSHRPSTKDVSPIVRVWAQICSFVGGHRLSTDQHTLPPPPSTVIFGS